jgi:hypothetical protein
LVKEESKARKHEREGESQASDDLYCERNDRLCADVYVIYESEPSMMQDGTG